MLAARFVYPSLKLNQTKLESRNPDIEMFNSDGHVEGIEVIHPNTQAMNPMLLASLFTPKIEILKLQSRVPNHKTLSPVT